MSELFCSQRLIDYFLIIDVNITNINQTINNEFVDKLSNMNTPKSLKKFNSLTQNTNNTLLSLETTNQNFSQAAYIKSEYTYKITKIFPSKNYTDIPEINFESILLLMPEEKIYLHSHQNEFFTYLIKPNNSNTFFYLFFLCVYTPLNTNSILSSNNNANGINNSTSSFSSLSLYAPKYICFVSRNPFFVSFRALLEEIYINSTKNGVKCFKVENILNILLYRIYLPSYHNFQISFCLSDKAYSFYNNIYKSEISYKILFNYLSIDNVLLIYFALLMNSVVVILHSDMEIIGIVLYIIKQFLLPLNLSYSIVTNLSSDHLELLDFNSGVVIGVYKNDYSDLTVVMSESKNNVIYVDIEENVLIADNNENIKEKIKIPNERMKSMSCRLRQILNESNNLTINALNQQNNMTTSNDNSVNNNNMRMSLRNANQSPNLHSIMNIKFEHKENVMIQTVFYEFIVDLFISFNSKRHILTIEKEDGDEYIFDYENFINDSPSELRQLLSLIKTTPMFDNFTKNLMLYLFNKKRLSENEVELFDIFFQCVDKIKRNKEIYSLFIYNITHTISFSSPPYEKLSYKQNNIFIDPFHEMMFKHTKAVELYRNKVNINLREEDKKDTSEKSSFIHFKKNLISEIEVVKGFYGVSSSNNTNSFHSSLISSINVMNSNLLSASYQKQNKSNSKGDYIKSFNELIKNLTFKGEFHINVALNVIQTYSLCSHCTKPNNIWDIRKSYEFSKARRETRARCKYCGNSFVPSFKAIIADENEFSKNNQSGGNSKRQSAVHAIIKKGKKEKKEQNVNYKTIEYMSFEHLLALFTDNQNEKIKRKNFPLYYNLLLLTGEIKCLIEGEDVILQTLSEYINEYQQNQMKSFEIFRQPTLKSRGSFYTMKTPIDKANGMISNKISRDKERRSVIEHDERSLGAISKISSITGRKNELKFIKKGMNINN